jgi:hypothetical protein
MAKGIAVPVRTNRRGGASTREGSTYTRQVLAIGLTPNVSTNPFQAGNGVEVGIDERFVFDLNSPGAQSGARRQITRFFARTRAADLARLAAGRDGVRFETESGEMIANVRYVELESDREGEFSSNLRDALRSAPSVNFKP